MARTSWGLSLWTTRAFGESRQKTELWHIKKIKWHEHWQGGITGGTMELLPDKRFDYIDMLGSFGITADNARVSAATISEKTHLGIPLPFRVKTAAGITLVDGIITSISFKAKKQRVVVKFKGAVEVLKTFTVMMTSNAAPSARYYIDNDSALAAVHKYALREGLENGLRSNSGRLLEFNITDALFDGIADTEWARTGFTKGEDPLRDKTGEMDWDR